MKLTKSDNKIEKTPLLHASIFLIKWDFINWLILINDFLWAMFRIKT